MMTKKLNYVLPAVRIISLESEGEILSVSGDDNEGGGYVEPTPGVGASSWADGNDDWFTPKQNESSIWK